ncbi:MAG: TonB-dependent receptor [Rhodocyclaceae bacterium]|nr:TonB-dependent receptor [Rhodocyclaceae bacterium]
MKTRALYLCLLVSASAAKGNAQTPSSIPTESKVSPAPAPKVERIEVTESQGKYDARREDTATKIVVTEAEIKKFGDTQLADVLKRLPSVTVRGTEVMMRGLGGGYTQILLDGQKAPPGFTIDSISPDEVERVEIIRAATADLSTQSIAGTINIVLKKKFKPDASELKIGYGRATGSRRPNVSYQTSRQKDNFSYSVVATARQTILDYKFLSDSFADDATGRLIYRRPFSGDWTGRFTNANVSPKLNWTLGEGHTFAWKFFLGRGQGSSNSSGETLASIGTPPPYPVTRNPVERSTWFARSDVTWNRTLAGGAKWELKAGIDSFVRRTKEDTYGYTPQRELIYSRNEEITNPDRDLKFSGKYTQPFGVGHTLAAGWDSSVGALRYQRKIRDNAIGSSPLRLSEQIDNPSVSSLALIAQNEWNLSEHWSVYAGLRWETIKTDISGNDYASVSNQFSVGSPILQTLWKFKDAPGWQTRLALTKTFKAPDKSDLTPRVTYVSLNNSPAEPDYRGNAQLKPELANGLDVALEKFWEKGSSLSLSATVRRISDVTRRNTVLTDGRWVNAPTNDGRAVSRSIELDTKFPVQTLYANSPPIDLRVNFSRNWSEVKNVPGPNNRLLSQTPFSATLGLDYRMKDGNFVAGGSITFRSGADSRTSVNTFESYPARREVDFYGLWKFSKNDQLRLTLANILREDSVNTSRYVDATGTLGDTSRTPSRMEIRLNLETKL